MSAADRQAQLVEARIIMERSRGEPGWFFHEILGAEPWSKQTEIAESVRDNPDTAVKSCHNSGKSWDAARIALWFLYSYPPSLVITTAPTDRQVKNILWREMRSAHANARYPLGGTILKQQLEIDDDWYAIGFTAAEYDPDRFQGFHNVHVLVVVDESAGVGRDIHTAIDGVLSGGHCRKLEIGQPTDPTGHFGEMFRTPDVNKITISAFDTPNFTAFGITIEDIRDGSWEKKIKGRELPMPSLISPAWVATRLKRWRESSPMFQARVLGKFPKQGKDTMFPLSLIEAAVERTLEPGEEVELGADIARFGNAETVIYRRAGPVFRLHDTANKEDSVAVEGRIMRAHKELEPIAIKIDGVGIGGSGPVDHLRDEGLPIVDVQAGGRANDPELYVDQRAEMFWDLKGRFEDGDIDLDPEDELVQEQLSSLTFKLPKGRVRVVSKEELSISPDRADALAMCNYAAPDETAVFDVW